MVSGNTASSHSGLKDGPRSVTACPRSVTACLSNSDACDKVHFESSPNIITLIDSDHVLGRLKPEIHYPNKMRQDTTLCKIIRSGTAILNGTPSYFFDVT